jgi:hypothetical protein
MPNMTPQKYHFNFLPPLQNQQQRGSLQEAAMIAQTQAAHQKPQQHQMQDFNAQGSRKVEEIIQQSNRLPALWKHRQQEQQGQYVGRGQQHKQLAPLHSQGAKSLMHNGDSRSPMAPYLAGPSIHGIQQSLPAGPPSLPHLHETTFTGTVSAPQASQGGQEASRSNHQEQSPYVLSSGTRRSSPTPSLKPKNTILNYTISEDRTLNDTISYKARFVALKTKVVKTSVVSSGSASSREENPQPRQTEIPSAELYSKFSDPGIEQHYLVPSTATGSAYSPTSSVGISLPRIADTQNPMDQPYMHPPYGNSLNEADVSFLIPFTATSANVSKPAFNLGDFRFDDRDALENFDFDSFLQNPNDDTFGMSADFDFNNVTEVVGDS